MMATLGQLQLLAQISREDTSECTLVFVSLGN